MKKFPGLCSSCGCGSLGVLQSPLANTSRKRGIFPSEWPQHLPLHSSEARDAIPHILQDSWSSCILLPGTGQRRGDLWLKDSPRHARGLGSKMQAHSTLRPPHRQVRGVPAAQHPSDTTVWEWMHPAPAPGITHRHKVPNPHPNEWCNPRERCPSPGYLFIPACSALPGVGKDTTSPWAEKITTAEELPWCRGEQDPESPEGRRCGAACCPGGCWQTQRSVVPGMESRAARGCGAAADAGAVPAACRGAGQSRARRLPPPAASAPSTRCRVPLDDNKQLVRNPLQLRVPCPHSPVLRGERTHF